MNKKKTIKIVVAFLSLLFIGLISNTIITEANNNCYEPGCRVTIRDIVAHDSMRAYIPSTVKEILDYAHNRNVPPGRTGWSAYELECTNIWKTIINVKNVHII